VPVDALGIGLFPRLGKVLREVLQFRLSVPAKKPPHSANGFIEVFG
jgi:hypothetical protein